MTGLVSYKGLDSQTHLPAAIDYPAVLALHQMALVHDELPKYLLAPKVSTLLHYVPVLHRKMLLATLWNTGARINEALSITRSDYSLAPPCPFVQLATLRQRTEKAGIWESSDQTVRTWLSQAVTPHTFRPPYAMHMLYASIPLKVQQALMGNKSVSSTGI